MRRAGPGDDLQLTQTPSFILSVSGGLQPHPISRTSIALFSLFGLPAPHSAEYVHTSFPSASPFSARSQPYWPMPPSQCPALCRAGAHSHSPSGSMWPKIAFLSSSGPPNKILSFLQSPPSRQEELPWFLTDGSSPAGTRVTHCLSAMAPPLVTVFRRYVSFYF